LDLALQYWLQFLPLVSTLHPAVALLLPKAGLLFQLFTSGHLTNIASAMLLPSTRE
jgi:hypothetical protein